MTRPQHACPVKGCRGYALGGDDEQEGAQHHRKRGDNVLQKAALASHASALPLAAEPKFGIPQV
jgi:hypothetical protein